MVARGIRMLGGRKPPGLAKKLFVKHSKAAGPAAAVGEEGEERGN